MEAQAHINGGKQAKLTLQGLNAAVASMHEQHNGRLTKIEDTLNEQSAALGLFTEQLKTVLNKFVPAVHGAPGVPDEVTDAAIAEAVDISMPAPRQPDVPVAARRTYLPDEEITELDLKQFSTEALRRISGLILAELKTRAAEANGSKPVAEREQRKVDYKQRKAEHAARKFGLVCVKTGKTLLRRIRDEADALRQAAELTVSMKREYRAIELTA